MRRVGALGLSAAVALVGLGFCASAQASVVATWGSNGYGQLGDGHTGIEQLYADAPVAVSGLSRVVQVAGGCNHHVALISNGTVDTWGDNELGQLGYGTFESPEGDPGSPLSPPWSDLPHPVPGLSEVVEVAAGCNFNLARRANGTVMAWGESNEGALGDGQWACNPTAQITPVEVRGLEHVQEIAAGATDALALLSDEHVMAWGGNYTWTLDHPNGHTACGTLEPTPVEAEGIEHVRAIAAGFDFNLALTSAGTVISWGDDAVGQHGDGIQTPETECERCTRAKAEERGWTPTPVSGLSEVERIAAGGHSALALLKNGEVRAWGANEWGELGDGSATGPETCTLGGYWRPQHVNIPCSDVPVAVNGVRNAIGISVAPARYHNQERIPTHDAAVLANGHAISWGANEGGELGQGKSEAQMPYADDAGEVLGVQQATQAQHAGATDALLAEAPAAKVMDLTGFTATGSLTSEAGYTATFAPASVTGYADLDGPLAPSIGDTTGEARISGMGGAEVTLSLAVTQALSGTLAALPGEEAEARATVTQTIAVTAVNLKLNGYGTLRIPLPCKVSEPIVWDLADRAPLSSLESSLTGSGSASVAKLTCGEGEEHGVLRWAQVLSGWLSGAGHATFAASG
jgi:alpha-tubulin suppressor-like RCC1 family protein